MKLTLASGSPRRRQLLEWSGWGLTIRPPNVDESRLPGDSPVRHAERLAEKKALAVIADGLVLAADTVVGLGDRILEKPVDRREAVSHLIDLSGGWHEVTTGVCVVRGDRVRTWSVTTNVRFRELDRLEIQGYVETGEADDKAGAYGIQGRAGAFVAELQGSWTNVMGLPMESVLAVLKELA